MPERTPTYQRILLKLSGEALMGKMNFGIDPQIMSQLVQEIRDIVNLRVQVAIVIGGGNIFRGVGLAASGIDRISGDYMGMLATIINGLAIQDALQKIGIEARVISAIQVDTICETYTRQRAMNHLDQGRVVIFVAGTGHPFFTTDSAASLRAVEMGVQLMIKATKVDGVYAADPVHDPTAQRFSRLSYNEVLARQLTVMDTTAIVLCRDNHIPLRVLDMGKSGALIRAVTGQDEGTLINSERESI